MESLIWNLIKIYVNLRLKSTPSFADDGDFVERPGPSCNLHYVCIVLCRGRAKRPTKEVRKSRPAMVGNTTTKDIHIIISGPNKQVIFESVNCKFVVNLLRSARFHVQQLINVLYFCWQ